MTPAPDAAATESLAAALALPRPLAGLLVQRGFGEPEAARAFLRPSLDQLADPFALAGMHEAVGLIAEAVASRVPILVHGDYDVDGQCAAALMTRVLRQAGATVHPFLPHRLRDGYDFGEAGLAAAADIGAGLIITCDCGITAHATVAAARAEGMRVVITDHHLPGPELPAANVILNPQRADDRSGLRMLCGTGVAFKLAQALTALLALPTAFPQHFLDYVALATIADVVPLVGENRILTRNGLRLLAQSRWEGLRALVEVAGLSGRELRAGQVGFILAPRLNAVGRIGDANDGLRLLLTDDPVEAAALAQRLDVCNRERQQVEQAILEQAIAMAEREVAAGAPALVLAGDGWHTGVIGIVASRLVERFHRPAFLIGFDGDLGRGSGRSIDGFDLHDALHHCDDLLERYGGHRMAAGLTITRVRFAEFRERFLSLAAARLTEADLVPTQRVDLVVALGELQEEMERFLRHLEPCGMGNPSPVFGVRGLRLEQPREVGRNHLKGTLSAPGARLDAIAFGWADRAHGFESVPLDVAVHLERNEYRGRASLQARIAAMGPSAA